MNLQEKRNVFATLFEDIQPKKEWNNEIINQEKELKQFLIKNIWWVGNMIKKIFGFTTIEFLGEEYAVYKGYNTNGYRTFDKYDLAFRHGEDIIIVELKTGYNSMSISGLKQLVKYKRNFEENHINKVYLVLITTYITEKIMLNYIKQYDDELAVILLDKEYCDDLKYRIDFGKTKWGIING